MDQVNDNYPYYYIAADYMDKAEKPTIWDFIGDGLDAPEGMIRMWDIIEKEHDTGYDLGNKGDQSDKAQGA